MEELKETIAGLITTVHDLKKEVKVLKNQTESTFKRSGLLNENIKVLIGEIKGLQEDIKRLYKE